MWGEGIRAKGVRGGRSGEGEGKGEEEEGRTMNREEG